METQEIVQKARTLIDETDSAFVMATVSPGGLPHVRWMGATVFEEPFTLYLETGIPSRKVEDIEGNPDVELFFNRDDFSEQLAVVGRASVEKNEDIKKAVYDVVNASDNYFDGPNDPRFGVIRVEAYELHYWKGAYQREPAIAKLED
ncbi:MAG: pyridoxamine 5'-phosphate oxidase family protein [Phycisphaerae bacterium]